MIRLALPGHLRDRVRCIATRDYYDDARWITAVRDGVTALLSEDAGVNPGSATVMRACGTS